MSKKIKGMKICVIGLGYVGLPLARLFSTKYETVGFDMNKARVDALMQGHDATLEVSDDLLQDAATLQKVWILRNHIADMTTIEAMNLVISNMQDTKNNEEFLNSMNG